MEQEYIEKEVVQRTCSNCGRIEARCKCDKRNIVENKVIVRSLNPNFVQSSETALFHSEAERMAIIEKKQADKQAKQEAREEMSAIMTMDPDELDEKKEKEDKAKKDHQKKLFDEAGIKATELQLKKQELAAKGLNSSELAKAIKAFKKEQRGEASEIDKLPEQTELKNPVKDPNTGMMIEKV